MEGMEPPVPTDTTISVLRKLSHPPLEKEEIKKTVEPSYNKKIQAVLITLFIWLNISGFSLGFMYARSSNIKDDILKR